MDGSDKVEKIFDQLLDDATAVGVPNVGLLIGPCAKAIAAVRKLLETEKSK